VLVWFLLLLVLGVRVWDWEVMVRMMKGPTKKRGGGVRMVVDVQDVEVEVAD